MNRLLRHIPISLIAITLISSTHVYAWTWNGFTQVASPPTGSGPEAIALGDFNRDGKADLAVTNVSSTTVTILLGNGDGTFTATTASPSTGAGPQAIAVVDLNGDGKPDIAVANHTSNNLTILLGNGDGTFTPAFSPLTGTGPNAIAVADFNKDGKPDLAVTSGGSSPVTILLGTGTGTFYNIAPPPLVTGSGPMGISAADFNGDGNPDFAVTNAHTNSTVEVLLGNGDGTFTLGSNTATGGAAAWGIAVGDLNGDGKLDIATTERDADGNSELAILLGNGNGTFATATVIPTPGVTAVYVVMGDFNGDGHLDVAIANISATSLAVLLGNGNGTFQTAITPGGANAYTVVTGDFNGDGHLDLAAPSLYTDSVTILLSNATGPC